VLLPGVSNELKLFQAKNYFAKYAEQTILFVLGIARSVLQL
jgi:hypothetical protein